MDIIRQNVAVVFNIRFATGLIRGLRRQASQNRRLDAVVLLFDIEKKVSLLLSSSSLLLSETYEGFQGYTIFY